MISIKSDYEIELMRISAEVTGKILRDLHTYIVPGISTMDINNFVDDRIRSKGMIPTFNGYGGFPGSACVSVNEEVVHGIPSKNRILKEGDIISVDVGSTYKGYVSDAARTYTVGKCEQKALDIIAAARESFFAGMEFCKVGYRLSDVSSAIGNKIQELGYGIIRDYVGHGVGRELHEDPSIPNYGEPGHGPRLKAGMTVAIEPMITEGSEEVKTLSDNWTVVTRDGKLAAHYENTLVITEDKPIILTLYDEEGGFYG